MVREAQGTRLLVWTMAALVGAFVLTSLDRFTASPDVRAFVARLLSAGCLDDRFFHGQVWKALTCMFMHGSPVHLLSNASALVMIWWYGRYCLRGNEWFWIFLVTGLVAGPAHILFHAAPPPDFTNWKGPLALYFWQPDTALVGASGGLMGLWGAMTAISVRFRMRHRDERRPNPTGMEPAMWIGPFLVQCVFDFLTPGVAGFAHRVGFLAGLLMGRRVPV